MPLKNLLYIGNKLSGRGLNVTTVETLSSHLAQEGYRIETSSSVKNPVLRLLDMLWSVVKDQKCDFVLIDTYSTSAFWYAFLVSQLCRILKKKYVPILHGGNLPQRLEKNPGLSRLIFNYAYRNVAPSNYLLHEFQKFGYTNIVFIPNSIEISGYPFKQRNGIAPKLLWVRAFSRIYNPKMAVTVFHKIKMKYPEAKLCMVGPDKDGSYADVKKYAASLSLEIEFTGQLPKAEWIALAAAYDIFINTTHFDNTPVSVMEAMALGLPVVTTDVGGIPFLLKNNQEALLVADNDGIGMVDAIVSLIENPEMTKEMVRKARIKAESWDWDAVKEQWKDLLS